MSHARYGLLRTMHPTSFRWLPRRGCDGVDRLPVTNPTGIGCVNCWTRTAYRLREDRPVRHLRLGGRRAFALDSLLFRRWDEAGDNGLGPAPGAGRVARQADAGLV